MSRGLTEEIEPEGESQPDTQDILQDIIGYVGMLAGRVEQLEDIMAKALSVHIKETPEEDGTRVNGL
jgi:hypothetical protein